MPATWETVYAFDPVGGSATITFVVGGVTVTSYTLVLGTLSVSLTPLAAPTTVTRPQAALNIDDIRKWVQQIRQRFGVAMPLAGTRKIDKWDLDFAVPEASAKFDVGALTNLTVDWDGVADTMTFGPRPAAVLSWSEFTMLWRTWETFARWTQVVGGELI